VPVRRAVRGNGMSLEIEPGFGASSEAQYGLSSRLPLDRPEHLAFHHEVDGFEQEWHERS